MNSGPIPNHSEQIQEIQRTLEQLRKENSEALNKAIFGVLSEDESKAHDQRLQRMAELQRQLEALEKSWKKRAG